MHFQASNHDRGDVRTSAAADQHSGLAAVGGVSPIVGNARLLELVLEQETNPEDIDEAIAQGASVDAVDDGGFPAITIAICNSNPAVVLRLLKHGASVTKKDDEGSQALHHALQVSEWSVCREIIERGANTSVHDALGNPPLHLAAWGPTGNLTGLLEMGVNPLVRNSRGDTFAHAMARCSRHPSVAVLQRVPLLLTMENTRRQIPLDVALEAKNKVGIVGLLCAAASIDWRDISVHKPQSRPSTFLSNCSGGLFGRESMRTRCSGFDPELFFERAIRWAVENGSTQLVVFLMSLDEHQVGRRLSAAALDKRLNGSDNVAQRAHQTPAQLRAREAVSFSRLQLEICLERPRGSSISGPDHGLNQGKPSDAGLTLDHVLRARRQHHGSVRAISDVSKAILALPEWAQSMESVEHAKAWVSRERASLAMDQVLSFSQGVLRNEKVEGLRIF